MWDFVLAADGTHRRSVDAAQSHFCGGAILEEERRRASQCGELARGAVENVVLISVATSIIIVVENDRRHAGDIVVVVVFICPVLNPAIFREELFGRGEADALARDADGSVGKGGAQRHRDVDEDRVAAGRALYTGEGSCLTSGFCSEQIVGIGSFERGILGQRVSVNAHRGEVEDRCCSRSSE